MFIRLIVTSRPKFNGELETFFLNYPQDVTSKSLKIYSSEKT
jgi:hypothetical protein